MSKKINRKITEALAKNHPCYVLITCAPPTEDGYIKVEMSYEGEPEMVAFLLDDAQSYMDSSSEVLSKTTRAEKVLPFENES